MEDFNFIEELSLNAHPSLKTVFYDGWILRFANGFTSRANCVNVIYTDCLRVNENFESIDSKKKIIEEKIIFCEKLYKKEGLQTIFKITPLNKDFCDLDSVLEDRGYKIITPTKIMTMNFNEMGNFPITAKITQGFTNEWEENYLRLKNLSDTKDEKIAIQIHQSIQQKVFTASILQNGIIVACGMCVIERGWVGLYDVFVDKDFRSHGLGFNICTSLLETARQNGAKKSYLQVVSDNQVAIDLYKKLGYSQMYDYWYRGM